VNIVVHDGGHREPTAHREPSVVAAGLLAAKYKASHRIVRVDSWV